MPNHIKNVLKFKNLKKADIDFIINLIAEPIEEAAVFKDGRTIYAIDFNKIIPQPQDESECPDDCKMNETSCTQEDADRPWFDWYEWNNKYWGTKWGAYDCYSIIGKSYITFVFTTAWRTSIPIVEQLKVLGYQFELRYADKAYGSNCGKIIFDPDKTGFRDLVHITGKDILHPNEFAKHLWDKY